ARLPARPHRRGQGGARRRRARAHPDRAHGRDRVERMSGVGGGNRSAVNTFAGGGLDRMGPRRTDDAWLAERRADPATRVVVATSDGVLVDGDRAPATVGVGELPDGLDLILLGVDGGGAAVFAADPGP